MTMSPDQRTGTALLIGASRGLGLAMVAELVKKCQSASKRDPLSACKRGPPCVVALGLMPGADFALGLA
jgi:hypothetical protein